MSEDNGYIWIDPEDSERTFLMTIEGPSRSGWYSALVEMRGGGFEMLEVATNILKEHGYYRPRDNWNGWNAYNTTYMRKAATYHELKVRRKSDD